MSYYVRSRQMSAERAAAASRQQALWKAALASSNRLDAAQQAYKNGDIVVASRLYSSVSRSRPKTAMTEKAKNYLGLLAEEAREKIGQIDATLVEQSQKISPGERLTPERWPDDWQDTVATAFDEYDRIVRDYSAVPAVKREIKSHVSKQRRQPDYAAVLKEPEAKSLCDLAHKHEQEDQACCAYWAYDEASKLSPAPSAQQASDRLAQMKQDPKIVASAETCSELRWCHRTYRLADRLVRSKPDRATELFTEIVQRSPQDSKIHGDAQLRIEEIRQ
jgi:hypothetical protein